jgi:ATP-binding cassette subfamily B protein
LLYLQQRLYEPTEGVILLDGLDIREISRDTVRRGVGSFLQEPFVFSRSVMENIRFQDRPLRTTRSFLPPADSRFP